MGCIYKNKNHKKYLNILFCLFALLGSASLWAGVAQPLYVLTGYSEQGAFGISVSAVGDLNNDGHDDFVVGARSHDNFIGAAYVYSGVDLSLLYTFDGEQNQASFGDPVVGGGDINNDGYGDIVVSAWGRYGVYAYTKVFSGKDGSEIYTIQGDDTFHRGRVQVSIPGDINLDGYDDFILHDHDKGSAKVFSGVDSSELYIYSTTPPLEGIIENNNTTAGIGDMNNDGYTDFIIGDPVHLPSGYARVYDGKTGTLVYTLNGSDYETVGDDWDWFGITVNGVGDYNADGYDDFVVGSLLDDTLNNFAGAARIFSGKDGGLLEELYGKGGYGDWFSNPILQAGDVNGDGYSDLLIGGNNGSGTTGGYARLFSGEDHSVIYTFDEPSPQVFSAEYARSLAAADINNDGYQDLIIGAPYRGDNSVGEVYVYSGIHSIDVDGDGVIDFEDAFLGDPTEWSDADNDGVGDNSDNCVNTPNTGQGDVDLDAIGNACDPDYAYSDILHLFTGDDTSDRFGWSVANAGDVNGDGYPEFIVGAKFDEVGVDGSGAAHVIDSQTGNTLYVFSGDSTGDYFGNSVDGAGDVNGDGYADLIVGAPYDDNNGDASGSVVVYSGLDGGVLHTLNGNDSADKFGDAVRGAGDVNNDGYADFIVGARADEGGGTAWVYSGVDGSLLHALVGESGEQFGYSVSGAGDVNNDGYDDVIVGARYDDNNGASSGSARVFSGVDGTEFYIINGAGPNYSFGISVNALGDIDNDNYDDIFVGSLVNAGSYQANVYGGRVGAHMFSLDGSGVPFLGTSVAGPLDINNDGVTDFLAAGAGGDNTWDTAGGVRIFDGTDGSIIASLNSEPGRIYYNTVVDSLGDINGDGFDDFIVGSEDDDLGGTNAGTVWVYSGFGFIDLDNDGLLNINDDDDDGDGTPDNWEISYGFDPYSVDSSADADGDGYTNLQEYNNGTDPLVYDPGVPDDYTKDRIAGWIWRGVANGVEGRNRTWTPNWATSSPGWVPPSRTYPPYWDITLDYDIKTTGDFDGDGDADIAWRSASTGDWRFWRMEDGNRVGQDSDVDANLTRVTKGAGDTDKDGDDDILLQDSISEELIIYEMQDNVHVGTHSLGTKTGYDLVRIADFDNDGDVDLLLQQSGGTALVFREIENNAFVQDHNTQQTGAGFETQCAGDFNNDGYPDVYLLAGDGTSKWFEYVGFVRQQQKFGANQSAWTLLGCGDYDGDGDMDILWTSADGNGRNKLFINEDFNNSATFYTNRYGGTNPANPGYGYEKRGNSN